VKLPAYPRTKPSGVAWLGDVPEHWEALTVRRRAKRIQTGGTPPTAEERYYEEGTVPWFGPGSFDDQIVVSQPIKLLNASAVKEGAARMFAAGATMVVTIGATLGKVSSLTEAGSCNQQITVIEFDQRRIHPRFWTRRRRSWTRWWGRWRRRWSGCRNTAPPSSPPPSQARSTCAAVLQREAANK